MMMLLKKIPADGERNYLYLFAVANMFWLLAAYVTALYVDSASPSGDRFAKRTLRAFVLFNVFMLFFIFVIHYSYSRVFIFASFATFLCFLTISRLLFAVAMSYMQKGAKLAKRIVILGYNEIGKTLVERFASQRKNFYVAGYFENENLVTELSLLPVIGNIEECIEYSKMNEIHEIYSTISPEMNSSIYDMVQAAEKSLIRFKFVPDFKLYINRNAHMEYLEDIPILSLRPEPLEDIVNAIKKRLYDIIFSSLVIVFVLSWLIPIMAALIKLSSSGPIFFVQLRSGRGNKEFKCLKFRTLKVNDHANSIQVTKNDIRITKLGSFLRKTNLDELPQFINVLLGNMSVVGPRPHMLKHTKMFSVIMNEYMIRHFVKPGVTGWAQVNGYRGEIKEDEQLRKRIEYDIWYMENWSLWLDIKIIWLTIYSTIRGDKNAY